MDFLLQFGVGAAQRISYDFLKLLLLLPIGIVLSLIITAIRKRTNKEEKAQFQTQKTSTKSTNKGQSKQKNDYVEKVNSKKPNTVLWTLLCLYGVFVVCLVTAALMTAIFRTAEVALPTAIITFLIIIAIILFNKWSKK